MSRMNRLSWAWPAITVLAIAVAFVSLTLRSFQDKSSELNKPKHLASVHSMRLALLTLSEAQNSALIANNERLGECIAQVGTSVLKFQQAYAELENSEPAQVDRQLLARIKKEFDAVQLINDQITSMLFKSTNRKAYELAIGPGLKLLQTLDAQLQSMVGGTAAVGRDEKHNPIRAVYEIRLSLLKIQSLLIPHISEPTEGVMDQLEEQIEAEEQSITQNARWLAADATYMAQIDAFTIQLGEFQKLKAKIIGLSRENSNVRSEALALNERRNAVLACEVALVDLERQIGSQASLSTIPQGR